MFVKRNEGHLVADVVQCAILRERQETDDEEFQEHIEYMNVKQSRLLATVERKQKMVSGALEEIRAKLSHEVLVLEDRISAEEEELFEKREAEGWNKSEVAGADVACEAVSGARSSEGGVRYLGELGVGVGQRVSLGNQSSISSGGGSQKKRKEAVRKESAETQEYES